MTKDLKKEKEELGPIQSSATVIRALKVKPVAIKKTPKVVKKHTTSNLAVKLTA